MPLAALYDIHGNLPALEAALQDAGSVGADSFVIGGDVLPGPMPRETLALLRSLGPEVQYILGNADEEVVRQKAGREPTNLPADVVEVIRWTAQQITNEDAQWIASWPLTVCVPVAGIGTVHFCHATPRNNTEVFTRMTPEERLLPVFAEVDADLVVCGHTHMQFDRTVGGVRVVNAGSVGMPYGEPRACWLLLGPDLQLRQTEYDLDGAAALIRSTDYPQAEEFAAVNVLRPPSEQEALAAFGEAGVE